MRVIREGKKQGEVAKLFGVTRQAIGKWGRKYREGEKELFERKREGDPRKDGFIFLLPYPKGRIERR